MIRLSLYESPPALQRWMGRYGTAVITTGLAIWARSSLHPWLGNQCEFSLFYLSVLATAWIAGTGPAIFAIILGTISAAYFFIQPTTSFLIDLVPDLVQLGIFVIVNVTATMLFSRLQRQRVLAENRSDENARLSESLRLADERKDEFLALLAHELRNPLAPIRSSLALLERKLDSAETVRRVCDCIGRNTNHLVRITDDLLDVSRFTRGKVSLQIESLDLRDAVGDAVEMTEELVRSRSHALQVLMPSSSVLVQGDRVRLAQLFANLLTNAAKYTPLAGRISLQVEPNPGSVAVSITDNGIGFSQQDARRILDPFMQMDTSRTREYGGLGLGLTIVNRLVALHGGSLDIHSRGPGLGSRFTVHLPSAPAATPAESHVESESAAAPPDDAHAIDSDTDQHQDQGPDHATATRSLLIVEDNVDASALLCELFQSEGYEVRIASHALEALHMASSQQPDVILCDIGLPGMDGYEFAQRLRRIPNARKTWLIALTGWGSASDQQLAIDAGFDLHLTKPIAFAELLEHVRNPASSRPTVTDDAHDAMAAC